MRSESRNSSGPSNLRMRTTPVPSALQDVRVRACALQQPVLAGEPKRLVIEGVAQEPRVVDLEDVDLRQVPVQRRRVGDRVQAVEGMGHVDEPALLSNRGERLREGHAAGDLLLEEQTDHFALTVGLDLLAWNHHELGVSRRLHGLERAAEDVVVGHRDAAEADLLRVLDELVGRDRAVVRPLGVKVQVDGDPVAIGERVVRPLLSRAALARELRVDDIELVGDAFEALGLGVPTRLGCAPRPAGRVACECLDGDLGPVSLCGHDEDSAGGCFERETLFTAGCGDEDRSRPERIHAL